MDKNDEELEPQEPNEPEEPLELEPVTDWEAEAKKARRINSRLRTQLQKATETKVVPPPKRELDDSQLDFLDLKGITDPEEIEIIQRAVLNSGQTVRQALKDDYVISKLETLRKDKEVKNATPSSTKRAGGQVNDLASALAKFDQTGQLPEDFKLRSEVVNAIADRSNTNKPAWH